MCSRSGRSPGGGQGNLLQCSCLENPMDRGGWQVVIHRVAKSRTCMSMCSSYWANSTTSHTRWTRVSKCQPQTGTCEEHLPVTEQQGHLPSVTASQLLELTQTHVHRVDDAIKPSHPLLLPSPPTFNLSQHQGLFQWVRFLHQVAKVLELQNQSFQWIFRTDFL